jgi:hypothetical protein
MVKNSLGIDIDRRSNRTPLITWHETGREPDAIPEKRGNRTIRTPPAPSSSSNYLD